MQFIPNHKYPIVMFTEKGNAINVVLDIAAPDLFNTDYLVRQAIGNQI